VHRQGGADRRLDVDAARDRNAREAVTISASPTTRVATVFGHNQPRAGALTATLDRCRDLADRRLQGSQRGVQIPGFTYPRRSAVEVVPAGWSGRQNASASVGFGLPDRMETRSEPRRRWPRIAAPDAPSPFSPKRKRAETGLERSPVQRSSVPGRGGGRRGQR